MKNKLLVAVVLVASVSANVYYYLSYSYTYRAHSICWNGSEFYRMFGDASEAFKGAIIYSPNGYSVIVHPKNPGRDIRIRALDVRRSMDSDGYKWLLNESSKFLRIVERDNGIAKGGKWGNCRRMARWLFEPVGKAKNIKCSRSTCRITGLKKEAGAKK